ncbi:unnamed protein product [Rhizophagus irregularis]|nr:unnamed protein product [Rhizophagus irregularis]
MITKYKQSGDAEMKTSEQVFSKSSATNAADLLHKKFTESNAKTSGILLFGLQLNKLKEYRETKSVKPHTKILKPVNEMTTSGLTKRATKISSKVSEQFSEIANNYYLSEDVPLLKSIEFSIKDKRYDIYYGKENQVLKHKKEVAIFS